MDEEAKNAKEKMIESLEPEDFIATMTPEDWKVVLSRDAKAELLEFIREECRNKETGQEQVDGFLARLRRREPSVKNPWFYQPMQPRPRHV